MLQATRVLVIKRETLAVTISFSVQLRVMLMILMRCSKLFRDCIGEFFKKWKSMDFASSTTMARETENVMGMMRYCSRKAIL